MTCLIVYVSVSHGNTKRIARAIGDELHADVREPEDLDPVQVLDYDMVGLGSGVYFGRAHRRLVEFARRLPPGNGRRAFVFATSGAPALPWLPQGWPLARILAAKGYTVVGSFSCRGWDTVGPLAVVGGFNRGRPNASDEANARRFAAGLAAVAGPARAPDRPARRRAATRS